MDRKNPDEYARSSEPQVDVPLADIRDMVDTVPAIMSYFDANLICRFANEYHFGWYGRSPSTMIGLHLRDIIGETDFANRMQYIERAFRGESSSFETLIPHHDGSYRDTAVRYVPRKTERGVEGFYILAFDVAVLHHRFHSVFDGTAVGFWMVDFTRIRKWIAEFGPTGAVAATEALRDHPSLVGMLLDAMPILDINHKTASLFHVPVEEAKGRRFGSWCPDESHPAFRKQLSAFIGGERFFETETVMRTASGQLVDVLLTCAFPTNDLTENAFIIGTTDISSRVSKEHELAKTQADLAHALRVATLGELMASITHEISQPLGAIATDGNGALRWLRRAEPDLREVELAIERMVSESTRASDIIARTRALAMKDAHSRHTFSLNEMIEETVQIVRRQLAGLGAEIILHLKSSIPAVTADRVQLQQVLINLLMNAAQAMAGQPGPKKLVVKSKAAEGSAIVSVTDNGPGLGDYADKVFDVFYTTKESGMGMGLTIAKSIISAHDGDISVTAGAEGGAKFMFKIPLSRVTGSPS
ncbi:PAS domain-containing sensor histidine kinase [Rhizobium leguminosarum]|uniref:PAS domain-containing sensor histidine kinase n=1 Tax=Rhizobium leguminosarum TaxID=384 RepID=UPI0004B5DE54|nr:ATP-binding protein [Rhizobium leguminosarum]